MLRCSLGAEQPGKSASNSSTARTSPAGRRKSTATKLGDNYADTFRVEDGVLKVCYDKYDGSFNDRFGHLFYKEPFSHLRAARRVPLRRRAMSRRPGWAFRNSGVMIHGQIARVDAQGPGLPGLDRSAVPRRRRQEAAHDRQPLHARHERRHERQAASRSTAPTARPRPITATSG